jgi:hypothetical protein
MRAIGAKVRDVVGIGVVLLLLVAFARFVLRSDSAPKKQVVTTELEAPPSVPVAPSASTVTPAVDDAADGIPLEHHDPRVPTGPVHPHPITPEHARLFEENRLFAALSAAMDRRDSVAMRQLLAEYEHEYPEDPQLLQAGFAVIADCIDHPGQTSTGAAQAYYVANKASILRRHVRRHCFEQNAP